MIFRQPCWYCGRSIRVDRDEWKKIHVGWTGQRPDNVAVMVHAACAPKAESARKHYEELREMIDRFMRAPTRTDPVGGSTTLDGLEGQSTGGNVSSETGTACAILELATECPSGYSTYAPAGLNPNIGAGPHTVDCAVLVPTLSGGNIQRTVVGRLPDAVECTASRPNTELPQENGSPAPPPGSSMSAGNNKGCASLAPVGAVLALAVSLLPAVLLSGCASAPVAIWSGTPEPPMPPAMVRRAAIREARSEASSAPRQLGNSPDWPATFHFDGSAAVSRFTVPPGSVVFWSSADLVTWSAVGRFDGVAAGIVELRDETAGDRPATFYKATQ